MNRRVAVVALFGGEGFHQTEAVADRISKRAKRLFGIETRTDMARWEYYDKIKRENDQCAVAQEPGVAVP